MPGCIQLHEGRCYEMSTIPVWNSLSSRYNSLSEAKKAGLQKGVWWTLGIIFILQLYFIRELLAAELIFGLGFAVLVAIWGVVYTVGAIGERGLEWSESHVRVLARSARRGFSVVEGISRKSFRHLRSESAR